MTEQGDGPTFEWSEEKFRALTAHSADIISLLDAQGTLLWNSEAAQRISGFDTTELEGVDTFENIHPEDRAAVAEEFGRMLEVPGQVITVRYRYRQKDGGWTWMEAVASNQLDNPAVRGVVANSRDITGRLALEAAQRSLAAQEAKERAHANLAALAGGVAHDFNNLLAVIFGEAELLESESAEQARLASLANIRSVARRAADLTQLLLAAAGKGQYRCEAVELEATLARLESELQGALREGVMLRFEIESNLPAAKAEPERLLQALRCLADNALDAVRERGGLVTVRARRGDLEAAPSVATPSSPRPTSGRVLLLEVEDSGVGMDAETRERIFEPFFSRAGIALGAGGSGEDGVTL